MFSCHGTLVTSSRQAVGSRRILYRHVTRRDETRRIPPSAADDAPKVLPHKEGARTSWTLLRQSGSSGVRPRRLLCCKDWAPARNNEQTSRGWATFRQHPATYSMVRVLRAAGRTDSTAANANGLTVHVQ
jgi:hypothetical protein